MISNPKAGRERWWYVQSNQNLDKSNIPNNHTTTLLQKFEIRSSRHDSTSHSQYHSIPCHNFLHSPSNTWGFHSRVYHYQRCPTLFWNVTLSLWVGSAVKFSRRGSTRWVIYRENIISLKRQKSKQNKAENVRPEGREWPPHEVFMRQKGYLKLGQHSW